MNEAKLIQTAKVSQNIVPAAINNADIPSPEDVQPKTINLNELNGSSSNSGESGLNNAQAGLISQGISGAVEIARIIKDGVVQNTSAKTGYYEPVQQEDHTTRWLAIGGVTAVVVIVILIIVLKK